MKKYSWRCLCICLAALQGTTALAQLQRSALDYMLQRPPVAKKFDNKKFGDHFFLEGGFGTNIIGRGSTKAGITTNIKLGDWISPEHGWRLGAELGGIRPATGNRKIVNLSLDYLMNLSAISNRNYPQPNRFELLGVAGAGYNSTHYDGNTQYGLDVHLGLRGQYAFSDYTYMYIEPQAGLIQTQAAQTGNWRKFEPILSLRAGVGYRLHTGKNRLHTAPDTTSSKHWTDNLFFSIAGGGCYMLNTNPSSWKDQIGGTFTLSAGKWFTPYHAIRLSANVTQLNIPHNSNSHKAIGARVEYMTNLHNLFRGVSDTRRWWVNGLIGTGIFARDEGDGRKSTPNFNIGLQGNIKLNNQFALFVEPRVDFYKGCYYNAGNTLGKWDVIPSLQAGLNYSYTYNPHSAQNAPLKQFDNGLWHDHTFIEIGAGINTPITRYSSNHFANAISPQAYMAVGRWFSPLHGTRIWGHAMQSECARNVRREQVAIGADYLFNISNAATGYRPGRLFDLTASLGMNMATREGIKKMFFGMNASVRGSWNVNQFMALFVEPKIQAYGKNFLPCNLGNSNIDWITSATAGVQFNLRNYNSALSDKAIEADGALRSSISLAGGIATQLNKYKNGNYWGPIGRIAYTHWFTPLSAWRAGLQGFANRTHRRLYAMGTVGADYITDLTAHAYGYDPDRVVSMTALVGTNLGIEQHKSRTKFVADLHAGGQLLVRVSPDLKLFAEPQLSMRLGRRFKEERLGRFFPQLMLGIDYSFIRSSTLNQIEKPARNQFVSAAFGTGLYSPNAHYMYPHGRKLTFISDLAYGQWFTGIHGIQGSLGHTHAQRYGKGSENLTSIHVNYMMNLRSAITGESTEDKTFQLTGLAGASLNIAKRPKKDARIAPGIQIALQAGWRVSPEIEVFVQPGANMYAKRLNVANSPRPFEADMQLTLGTKYRF